MPLLNNKCLEDLAQAKACRLFLWKIEESEAELKALLPAHFGYAEEAARFLSAKRRLEWLTARVLLHYVAGVSERLGYKETGRPALSEGLPFVSISHTGHYVTLLISPTPAGIDIEQKGAKAKRISSFFLKTSETALLSTTGLSEEDTAVVLWCAKESVYKMVDMPGLSLLHDITFQEMQVAPQGTSGTLRAEVCSKDGTIYPNLIINYNIQPDFVITFCTTNA